ncbi:hypothetical protein NLG42_02195 [Flavobacterium plurextorum]|nr:MULTISPECIES: hypothetical protein [Flavobacterium]UUW09620.1 hypothetical protein NLG42_02195 [Flavobacterium plurextorum]
MAHERIRTAAWGIIILLDYRNSKMRQTLLNSIYDTILKDMKPNQGV